MSCYECDKWGWTLIPNPPYDGLSRTAVDVNRLYREAVHAGPTGRGGTAWVSDRGTGRIMQYNLRDGSHQRTFDTYVVGRGHGIAVHSDTGSCLAGPGAKNVSSTSYPKLFYCDIQNPASVPKLLTTLTTKSYCYGIVPLYGYPDRFFVTDYNAEGPGGIYVLGKDYNSGTFTSAGILSGYAAAACPNGFGIQAGIGTFWGCALVEPLSARAILKDFTISDTNVKTTETSRIGVDNYSMYPNTILNSYGDRDSFCVKYRNEYNITAPLSATTGSQVQINWAISPTTELNSTPGYDGENNLWRLQSSKSVGTLKTTEVNVKNKLYRTAGDWFADDSIDNRYEYPYGGLSRYPTSTLDNWSISFTNTKEIEWFLTRSHGLSTRYYTSSTYALPGQSPALHNFYTLKEIDPPTLDNTTSFAWDPSNPLVSQTAYTAWWSMVEQKMIRVSMVNSEGPFAAAIANWTTKPYYKVYNSSGIEQTGAKKWGIRMAVSGYNTFNIELDDFYEHYTNTWKPQIINKIKAWAAAFANIDTAYSGLGLSEDDRLTKVTNNQTGITVHSFYKYATPFAAYPYVNPSLPLATQNAVKYYANQLKEYDFKSPLVTNLYMYSDFTGNILTGTIESTPLNVTITHPEPADPSIVLAVSGFQSNPDYQDSPSWCYPWKNTLPISMSALYNNITGYDDFTVTFVLSAFKGSYDFSSFRLSTDDYMPSNLSDIGNIDILFPVANTNGSIIKAYTDYTYHSPSMNGLWYLPSSISTQQYLTPAARKPNGKFISRASIQAVNLYNYDAVNGCNTIQQSASATITVLERWPEPRFFIDVNDDKHFRQNFFCNNTWGRSCPETYQTTEFIASNCPAGFDGYTTWTRSVTVIDDIPEVFGDWTMVEGYCYTDIGNEYLTAYSASCVSLCASLYEGIDTSVRDIISSYFTGVTSNNEWMYLSTVCFPPSVYHFTYNVSGVPCTQALYEGVSTVNYDISVTKFSQISVDGSWTSSLTCYAPIVSLITSVSTCGNGYLGYTTVERTVSTTYFTNSSYYSDWLVTSTAMCSAPDRIAPGDLVIAFIDEAETGYTNKTGQPGPYWTTDVNLWNSVIPASGYNPSRFMVFDIDNVNGGGGKGYIWPEHNTYSPSSPYKYPPNGVGRIVCTTRPKPTTQTAFFNTVISTLVSAYGSTVWTDLTAANARLYIFVDNSGSMDRDLITVGLNNFETFLTTSNVHWAEYGCTNEAWIAWFVNAAIGTPTCTERARV